MKKHLSLLASFVLAATLMTEATFAEIIVPDWTSPSWGQQFLEMSETQDGNGPFGTSLDSITLAAKWGFIDGIREYCGENIDVYLLALGQILRSVGGNTDNGKQMAWLIAIHALYQNEVKEKMTPSDCQSDEAKEWILLQDSTLDYAVSKGLKLATDEELEAMRDKSE